MKKICIALTAVLFSIVAFSQDSTIQMFGKIFDKNMNPLENVRVVLKGTKFKTTTNGEGSYFFMLPAQKGVLVYSRAGYETKENHFTGTPQATDLILIEEKSKKKSN